MARPAAGRNGNGERVVGRQRTCNAVEVHWQGSCRRKINSDGVLLARGHVKRVLGHVVHAKARHEHEAAADVNDNLVRVGARGDELGERPHGAVAVYGVDADCACTVGTGNALCRRYSKTMAVYHPKYIEP